MIFGSDVAVAIFFIYKKRQSNHWVLILEFLFHTKTAQQILGHLQLKSMFQTHPFVSVSHQYLYKLARSEINVTLAKRQYFTGIFYVNTSLEKSI